MSVDGGSAPLAWPRGVDGEFWRFLDALPPEQLPQAFIDSMGFRLSSPAAGITRRLLHIARHGGTEAEQQAVERTVERILAAMAPGEPALPHGVHAVMLLGAARAVRAVPHLITLLPGTDWRGHYQAPHEAITVLGDLGGAEATEALLRMAAQLTATDPAPVRRCGDCTGRLVRALARIGTPACVDALLTLTREMDALWDAARLQALVPVADRRFVPFFLELCAGPLGAVGLAGLSRVATKRAVPALLRMLGDASADARTHRTVARALAAVGLDVASTLTYPLLHGNVADPRDRRAWVWALGQVLPENDFSRRSAFKALVGALADQHPGVRASAAGALARAADPSTEAALVRALCTDADHRVRARAAGALGGLTATEATRAALGRAAEADPVACVRAAAAAAARRQG